MNKNEQMRSDLKVWANSFNINQRALKHLIKIINNRIPKILPDDPRTLLQTPTNITLQNVGNGFYWHQGLEFCLRNCLAGIDKLKYISININVDGLPIYKSTKDEFWPILFNIYEMPEKQPMVIGIYNGQGKPSNLAEFITPFVQEAKNILVNGIDFGNGHILKVKIRCFICDSPARAFIKGNKTTAYTAEVLSLLFIFRSR